MRSQCVSHMQFVQAHLRNDALNADVLASFAYRRAFCAPTFNFAFAAVETCRLFDVHSFDLALLCSATLYDRSVV